MKGQLQLTARKKTLIMVYKIEFASHRAHRNNMDVRKGSSWWTLVTGT